eukprot:CAMPEP_0206142998 /NCGR_PEP_ID=MMETSP1473-20131121/18990_1 /ASSEMBLY_ACC=CAM_ASM_001109 /TAXON_ID=1461547 /ORGANISM="Stichococcus sp, Strain RCC1054" /LENGTH=220 /DNA_ID=CAMNT_0053538221 /DNA_START=222 /DNA_END=884 /DNA_ORIENTATION=-
MASASKQPAYEAWVKGYKKDGKLILGDCPFCHRALLTLEEKKVPYTKDYIDLKAKPEWIFGINEKGSVPVIKDLSTEEWINDSALFVDTLEDKYPEPALGKDDSKPEVGGRILPVFKGYLQSTDEDAEEKKAALEEELGKLSEHLKANGPFLKGDNISTGDLALAPKLYHMKIALGELKGYRVPAQYGAVLEYLDRIQQRDSWKNTYYAPEIVVAGWKSH